MAGPGSIFDDADLGKHLDDFGNQPSPVNDINTMPFKELMEAVRQRISNSINRTEELRYLFAYAQWMFLTDMKEVAPPISEPMRAYHIMPMQQFSDVHLYRPAQVDQDFDIDIQKTPECVRFGVVMRAYSIRMGRPMLLRFMVESAEDQYNLVAEIKEAWAKRGEETDIMVDFDSFNVDFSDFFGYSTYLVEYSDPEEIKRQYLDRLSNG